jgi:5S rRNA maturation endonuclease (ribonuclease M5)
VSKSNFKWLIVVEGRTDVETYHNLLIKYGINKDDFRFFSMGAKDQSAIPAHGEIIIY